MMNLIRIGDDTRPRIKVETASTSIRFDGRYVARKGDRVSCLQHAEASPNLIEEGDSSMTDGAV
ncbi:MULTISPECIES: PAAR domain-containing protein [Burkholderia]|uniref:PAAR domain-containing protein n=1 Tax=Burkholderia TaxID=32008 RepID=UPI000E646D85|nr:PAAR domain-containing protein [Burkholderia sp. HAN2018]